MDHSGSSIILPIVEQLVDGGWVIMLKCMSTELSGPAESGVCTLHSSWQAIRCASIHLSIMGGGSSGEVGASAAISLVLRIATVGPSLASAIMTAASMRCVPGRRQCRRQSPTAATTPSSKRLSHRCVTSPRPCPSQCPYHRHEAHR